MGVNSHGKNQEIIHNKHNIQIRIEWYDVTNGIVSPPNSYMESITPDVTIFGDGGFKEVNKIK